MPPLVPLLQQPVGGLAGRCRRRPPRARWAGSPWRRPAPAASACAAWRPARSRAPGSAAPCPARRRRAPLRRCRSACGSPCISTKKTPIARIAIQAPARNLVISTMTSTTAVNARPMVLISRERIIRRRAAGSVSVRRCRVQCRIMPELAEVERDEDARRCRAGSAGWSRRRRPGSGRSPSRPGRRCRCCRPAGRRGSRAARGAKPSWARIEPSTGKPLKAVLAASTRIMPVTVDHEVEAGREVVEDRLGDLGDHRVLVVALGHAARRRCVEPLELVRVDVAAAPSGWPAR